eukprot:12904335-Prorocentrum_lima.AAC.1
MQGNKLVRSFWLTCCWGISRSIPKICSLAKSFDVVVALVATWRCQLEGALLGLPARSVE